MVDDPVTGRPLVVPVGSLAAEGAEATAPDAPAGPDTTGALLS